MHASEVVFCLKWKHLCGSYEIGVSQRCGIRPENVSSSKTGLAKRARGNQTLLVNLKVAKHDRIKQM